VPKDVSIIGFDDLELGMFTIRRFLPCISLATRWGDGGKASPDRIGGKKGRPPANRSTHGTAGSAIPWCGQMMGICRTDFPRAATHATILRILFA